MRDITSYEGKPQLLYDDIVGHLRRQNCKCMDDNGNCLYRGLNNFRCAVGGVIPDRLLRPSFESRPVAFFFTEMPDSEIIILLGKSNKYLLESFQLVHDDYELDEWETGFKNIARANNLIYREIDNVEIQKDTCQPVQIQEVVSL